MKTKVFTSIMLVLFLVSIAFNVISVYAVSYSDADGDGDCEVGETITFVGDDIYDGEEITR